MPSCSGGDMVCAFLSLCGLCGEFIGVTEAGNVLGHQDRASICRYPDEYDFKAVFGTVARSSGERVVILYPPPSKSAPLSRLEAGYLIWWEVNPNTHDLSRANQRPGNDGGAVVRKIKTFREAFRCEAAACGGDVPSGGLAGVFPLQDDTPRLDFVPPMNLKIGPIEGNIWPQLGDHGFIRVGHGSLGGPSSTAGSNGGPSGKYHADEDRNGPPESHPEPTIRDHVRLLSSSGGPEFYAKAGLLAALGTLTSGLICLGLIVGEIRRWPWRRRLYLVGGGLLSAAASLAVILGH